MKQKLKSKDLKSSYKAVSIRSEDQRPVIPLTYIELLQENSVALH